MTTNVSPAYDHAPRIKLVPFKLITTVVAFFALEHELAITFFENSRRPLYNKINFIIINYKYFFK